MTGDEEPRPAEVWRRVNDLRDEMRTSFRDLGVRLDRMPTNDILLAYLATRDQEMKTLGENLKELTADLATERTERMAADTAQSERMTAGQRWALTFAVSVVVAVVGLAAFIINVSGAA